MHPPDPRELDLLRRMSPGRRLQLACELTETVRELAVAGLLARHPDWTRARAIQALAEQALGASPSPRSV